MAVFDCEKEIITIVRDGRKIKYTKEHYPFTNDTYYVLRCPKYLHSALIASYKKYGVDVYDKNHITLTNEDGIVEVWKEIKKGEEVYHKYHNGENVTQLCYGPQHQFSIAFVKGNFDDYDRFMVNHYAKRVSAVHGYPGAGKEYAKKIGYEYVDLW